VSRPQRNYGLVSQRGRDRQVFPTLFRMSHVNRDIMLRHSLDSQAVSLLDLQAIYSDVIGVPVVKIAADGAGLVNDLAAIAAVETKERQQIIQVHILVDDHLWPSRPRTGVLRTWPRAPTGKASYVCPS
jgi:hypothetical protein